MSLVAFGAVITTLSLYVYYDSTMDSCKENSDVERTIVESPIREKPVVLVWLAPLGIAFDVNDCDKYFNIKSCVLTYDRSLYNRSDAVIIFHKDIEWSLGNLPAEPRPPAQKWIWYHVESPTNTARIPGLGNRFNLTLNYRRDADINVRNELMIRKSSSQQGDFVLPKKERLLCWIVSNKVRATGTGVREAYYQQLIQHIKVDVFGSAFTGRRLPYEEYYPSIASCKFYLSFENSIHRDYITEKVNGPLVAGTVPVVMGPPRENYEQFIPSGSFIHVDDFPGPKALAERLLQLDRNHQEYMSYFGWRASYRAEPHLLSLQNEFTQPVCEACDYMARDRASYSVMHNLYHSYFT